MDLIPDNYLLYPVIKLNASMIIHQSIIHAWNVFIFT